MATISIRVQDERARRLLQDLSRAFGAREDAMRTIGAALLSSTQQRFLDERGPDGTPWAPLQESTIRARVRRRGNRTKGRSKGPASTIGETLTILRDRGQLFESLTYEADADSVTEGSNRVQAALQQLGGEDDMAPGAAAVPARPFLGISAEDEVRIGDVLVAHFAAAANAAGLGGVQ